MLDIIAPFLIAVLALTNLAFTQPQFEPKKEQVLGESSMSLEKRQDDPYVNSVFKENILLNMAYLDGSVKQSSDIKWEDINRPFEYELLLGPGEVFSFHEDVLPRYQDRVKKTTNAHFNATDGFKFSGLYYGDGVCHLASLIYKTSKEAGLNSYSPVSHDFAPIPEVEREYGVSIFYTPGQKEANSRQNLYIENNKEKTVKFKFKYDGESLRVKAVI